MLIFSKAINLQLCSQTQDSSLIGIVLISSSFVSILGTQLQITRPKRQEWFEVTFLISNSFWYEFSYIVIVELRITVPTTDLFLGRDEEDFFLLRFWPCFCSASVRSLWRVITQWNHHPLWPERLPLHKIIHLVECSLLSVLSGSDFRYFKIQMNVSAELAGTIILLVAKFYLIREYTTS